MNTKTRTISVLLSLCLIVSMLTGMAPVSATASPENTTANYHDNIANFTAPDIIEIDEVTNNHYIGREKESETDLYTFVFKNEDGSNTMRVFSHPVKYVDENGVAQDISLDITQNDVGIFEAANHYVRMSLASNLVDGISLEYEDIKIDMSATSISSTTYSANLSDDSRHVSYKADDNTMYVYSLTYAGIKEEIVVQEYTGQTTFSFILSTNGLHPVRIDDSVFLADADGTIRASIGDIIVFTADERNNTLGQLLFEPVIENSEYIFTILLDSEYLEDERTVYPITIDPTIEINYSNNGAGAIEDVTVNQNVTFGGTSGSLYVGRHPAGSLSRALMKFPNLKLDFLPTNITAASIEIRDLMCQGNEDIDVECCVYKEFAPEWAETTTTTWNDVYGNYLGDILDTHTISYGNGNVSAHRYSYNITKLAKQWASGIQNPSHGVVFKASDSFENQTGSSIKTWYKTFASYNRANYKPSLSITYNTIRLIVGKSKDISSAAAGLSGVTWSSNNTSVATVNNGIVTGISKGTTTISFTSGSTTTNCTVQVRGNGGTTYVSGGSLPKKTSLTISSGTSYIIRLYPYSSGYYSFFTAPESTTTLTDTTIAVYSDSALTNVLAFDDDGGYSTNSCVSVYLNAYTPYYFVLSAYLTSASGVVTYNIRAGFPVTGSEIAYNPSLWNYYPIQYNTNCYSYALNTQLDFDGYLNSLQPGASSYFQTVNGNYITPLYQNLITAEGKKLLINVNADAITAGFTFKEVSRTEMCSNGTYKVALVVAPYTGDENYRADYHWYRQNPDGTWSHKPGGRTVRNVDNSEVIIWDPTSADRYEVLEDETILYYSHVIGFYQVTPINNMISSSSFMNQNSNGSIQIVFDEMNERPVSIAEWLIVNNSEHEIQ